MRVLRKTHWWVLAVQAVAIVGLLTACDKKTPPVAEIIDAEPAVEAWAVVNGSSLTEPEVDYALNRFFGNQFVDARVEAKIRDSLIASRALAQKAATSLDPATVAELELAVNAYREERLIAAYIENTSTPEPVSAQMVTDYYQDHLEEFGAATLKRMAVLEANLEDAGLPQSSVSKALFEFSQQPDWSQLVLPSYIRSYSVTSNAQLSQKMMAALNATAVGSNSSMIVDAPKIMVFRVVGEETIPAKPLVEVSVDIRKRLAATMLSKTVKALTEQVVGASDIIKNY